MATFVTARGFPIQLGEQELTYYTSLLSSIYTAQQITMNLTNRQRLYALFDLRHLYRLDYPNIGSLEGWFEYLLTDFNLTVEQLMLIEDTVTYLTTGALRRTPLTLYDTILESHLETAVNQRNAVVSIDPKHREQYHRTRKRCLHVIRHHFKEKSMLVQWVSTENGLMDYIKFWQVVIGSIRS